MNRNLLKNSLIFIFLLGCMFRLQSQDRSSGSILMVLDVQEHFVDNMMKEHEANEFIKNLNEIIRIARPMDIVFRLLQLMERVGDMR